MPPLTRRAFARGVGVLAAAPWMGACMNQTSGGSGEHVVVVGAGMAGLAAARRRFATRQIGRLNRMRTGP